MDVVLKERLRDISALEEIAKTLESRQSNQVATEARLKALRENYVTLVKKWQAIQIRAKKMGNNADAYTDAATQAETSRLQQINRLVRKVDKLGVEPQQREYLLGRLNQIKGVTLFEIARHSASRDEIYSKLQESTNQLRETKARLSTIETLLADNKTVIQNKHSGKFPALKDKTVLLQQQTAEARVVYQTYLRSLAKSLLDERRQRLTNYITETYLGMERVENMNAPVTPKASEKL